MAEFPSILIGSSILRQLRELVQESTRQRDERVLPPQGVLTGNMELSVQNSVFLGFLNKLDIDVKQFPERTFDGLFENVPELNNYFFSWFMEYITADNALTQSEQATYFHLASSQALPTEEEVDYVLSSSSPSYEDLVSLDVNYTNLLSEELEDLNKYYTELSSISDDIECRCNDVKKKQNGLKEVINARKKQLNILKENCQEVNKSFGSKLDEVKSSLLEEPCLTLDFDLFNALLPKEGNVIHKFKSSNLVEDNILNFPNLDLLCELEEDLHCADISIILTEGFLRAKREKVDFLSDLLQKRASQKNLGNQSFFQPYLANNEGMDESITEEIKVLESELFEKWKVLSHWELQKISDEYLFSKIDLYKSCIEELTACKNFINSDLKINSYLLHVLLRSFHRLERVTNLRKQIHKKLNTYNTNFSKDVINFELRKQRFGELTTAQTQNQHLPLSAVENATQVEENPEQRKETLTKLIEFISQANDDSSFITHGFRIGLQSGIKGILNTTLCGPTSQLLFAPVELLIKFYECEEWDSKLNHVIKRLVNKYVAAKATVSKSDRRILLLWIDFVIKMNQQLGNR